MPDQEKRIREIEADITEIKKDIRRLKEKDDIFWSKAIRAQDQLARIGRKLKIRNLAED